MDGTLFQSKHSEIRIEKILLNFAKFFVTLFQSDRSEIQIANLGCQSANKSRSNIPIGKFRTALFGKTKLVGVQNYENIFVLIWIEKYFEWRTIGIVCNLSGNVKLGIVDNLSRSVKFCRFQHVWWSSTANRISEWPLWKQSWCPLLETRVATLVSGKGLSGNQSARWFAVEAYLS